MNVRAFTRRLGEMRRPGRAQFYSYLPRSILITTITVISKEDFRPHRFTMSPLRSKAAGEEVINLLAQANPQTRFTVLRPQSLLLGPHDKVFIPRLAHMMQIFITVASYYCTGAARWSI